jgi:hypothetical protein
MLLLLHPRPRTVASLVELGYWLWLWLLVVLVVLVVVAVAHRRLGPAWLATTSGPTGRCRPRQSMPRQSRPTTTRLPPLTTNPAS